MIYFVRHGETEWNKLLKCQGRADISLSDSGMQSAKTTAELLKTVHFYAAFASPLLRAKQTFEIIVGRAPEPEETDLRLSERDFGEFEGKTRSEFDFKDFWNADSRKVYERAESLSDFYGRVFGFVKEIAQKYTGNVLIVSHGGVGFVMNAIFNGVPKSRVLSDAEIPNGSFVTFDPSRASLTSKTIKEDSL